MARKKITKNVEEKVIDTNVYADEYIPVVNLYPGLLTLSTEPNGTGRQHNFPSFGDRRNVSYQDLVRIIDNNQGFLEKGFFYILDERVIRKHGLDEVYKKLATKEKLEKAFELKDNALEIYEFANEHQRKFIDRVLISKIRDGKNVDLNLVKKIEEISGVDIMEKAREAKEFTIEK